ncbi:hypothetical protein [Kitasatospora sp. NPDC057198]|uniref:hypothetical protein n=1 Tax=Kitasatospora sp. NPDC057198 TaxID=3346046 RepID=UPI0036439448
MLRNLLFSTLLTLGALVLLAVLIILGVPSRVASGIGIALVLTGAVGRGLRNGLARHKK